MSEAEKIDRLAKLRTVLADMEGRLPNAADQVAPSIALRIEKLTEQIAALEAAQPSAPKSEAEMTPLERARARRESTA